MVWFEEQKPVVVMVVVQAIFASVVLLVKPSLDKGMSEMVFITYRHIAASIFLAPVAYMTHRRSKKRVENAQMKSFALVFLAALIGVTISQKLYLTGLHLGSSSLTTAMSNLTPGVTFLMSASVGLEKVNIRSSRSIAKILGTTTCISGALSMAFFKGKKLFKGEKLLLRSSSKDWLIACLCLLGNNCCSSLWLILQVPLSDAFPESLVLSFWTCLFAAFQCSLLTLMLERDPTSWRLSSNLEIITCIYAGVVGSAVNYYLQAWCVSRRGPLFSAVFNPSCTVITTMLAFLLFHEDLYIGSLIGAAAVIAGLYAVVWGKAENSRGRGDHLGVGHDIKIRGTVDNGWTSDVEQPLLPGSPRDAMQS